MRESCISIMIKIDLPEKIKFDKSPQIVKTLIDQTLLQSSGLISDIMEHLTLAGGKNFRAMLLLAAATDKEGYVTQNALLSAAAVEILHLATLVHDDVIDDAGIRRGQTSIQTKFGKKSAVICGDFLFCKCFLLVAEVSSQFQDKFSDIAKAMTKICLGELKQFRHNGDTAMSTRNYLKIIAGKTSALFSLALYSGSIIGEYDEKYARCLALFGYYIGMIFQLTDDCMDYETDIQTAKKSVKNDLVEGVITLPLIYAISLKPEIKDMIKKHSTLDELSEVFSEVISLGGVAKTRDLAERYYQKAKKILVRLDDERKQLLFSEILEKIKVREF